MKASGSASTLLILALGMSGGCSSTPTALAPAAIPSGIDLAGMDKSVAPGDDFNQFTQSERQVRREPELPDQHDHVAGGIYGQHPNDVADVQNVPRDRARPAIRMAQRDLVTLEAAKAFGQHVRR